LKQHHASDSVLKALATSKKGLTMNYELTVTGMTCGHCEKAVTRALLQVDPNAKVSIDRNQNRVSINSDKDKPALVQVIVEEGYTVAD
jgi:copper chaperone